MAIASYNVHAPCFCPLFQVPSSYVQHRINVAGTFPGSAEDLLAMPAAVAHGRCSHAAGPACYALPGALACDDAMHTVSEQPVGAFCRNG